MNWLKNSDAGATPHDPCGLMPGAVVGLYWCICVDPAKTVCPLCGTLFGRLLYSLRSMCEEQ